MFFSSSTVRESTFAIGRKDKRLRKAERASSKEKALLFVLVGIISFALGGLGYAKEVTIEADKNNDGKTDHVAYYDPQGNMNKLEIDSNADGFMDLFQYFHNGELVSIEEDKNHDQRIDGSHYYKEGKRIKCELDTNGLGSVDQITLFDDQERLFKVRKDDTGDGFFENTLHFIRGKLVRCTIDADGDGKEEQVIYYHENGSRKEVHIDLDKDGTMETIQVYRQDEVWLEKKDLDENGSFEVMTWERDTDFDGKKDTVINFGGEGNRERVESDRNHNGKPETKEYYKNGELVRIERDERETGRATVKAYYRNEKKYKLVQDRDNNGRFELTERFDNPHWSRVMEIDIDEDGRPDNRYYYKKDILRLEEIDENGDGHAEIKSYYNTDGRLNKREEYGEATLHPSATWFYNDAEEAIRAEEDSNGDGQTDIWYYYQEGRVTAVEEDTNSDGKPDLWEQYDTSETLVERARDLNYDGEPDVKDDVTT